jgi:hypothetical protein
VALLLAASFACEKADSPSTAGSSASASGAPKTTSQPSTELDPDLEGPSEQQVQQDTKDINQDNAEGALKDIEQEVNAPY